MKIKVIELFAGVGGFRIGLEGYPEKQNSPFKVIWSNQWEPSTKLQHANMVYEAKFGAKNHCGQDISSVETKDIPDHDMLVGGFPCQDYSVATTLKRSDGLIGKKGVLWWQINRIIEDKKDRKPKYLLLENVDRLLKSPASQRGRDFAIMLSSLNAQGYAVEWRVINAAEYGMPQRRRRIFIMAYHNTTETYKRLENTEDKEDWLLTAGLAVKAFPSAKKDDKLTVGTIDDDLTKVSDDFNKGQKTSPFQNAGVMINGTYWSHKYLSSFEGKRSTLNDVLIPEEDVPAEFYIADSDLDKWTYLKGAKSEERVNKAQGFTYKYSEGAMVFPDALDNASRTIITGEGGKSASRFKHVVNQNGKLRRLTPVELERLNMFPDNHTKLDGITDTKRAFFMGNALVVGVIEKLAKVLADEIKN
ncbi:DNA-cytosine methyltransferase [Formosa agariphila KMM 3901]|uniref:Cytosine-specific methyltransferase n=1 Tax=Formosa agariphila (strain DSM 15362 / KCTC 12365 / LMG 23005 / KMM 3901 / M-2Alg 35-1) TaxID=1347342 RepID=T2KPR2_FORAG|nr:DNA (cytosine-5-)-methyltransferase [Formosa agariphila]CDF80451.1 DNA-cytosine methyltransferase [Formosa agariphila KMM 3901]